MCSTSSFHDPLTMTTVYIPKIIQQRNMDVSVIKSYGAFKTLEEALTRGQAMITHFLRHEDEQDRMLENAPTRFDIGVMCVDPTQYEAQAMLDFLTVNPGTRLVLMRKYMCRLFGSCGDYLAISTETW